MKDNTTLSIRFGPLSPALVEQLKGAGLRFDVVDILPHQKSADAVTRLHVHGILADSEAARARQRLTKKIIKTIRSYPISDPPEVKD